MWYYEKCRDYLRYYESMFVFDENNTRKGRKHEGERKIKMICCFFLIIVDLDPLLTLISMYLMILRISLVIYDNYNAIMCKLHDLREIPYNSFFQHLFADSSGLLGIHSSCEQ